MLKRIVIVAIAFSLSACSATTRTVPIDRTSARSIVRAATIDGGTVTYPAPARCTGHDQLEFAVAAAANGTDVDFNGKDTLTFVGSPVRAQTYVTVTACRGVLATATTTSWGWNTSATDPIEDCPGLAIVPPSTNYIYATNAPASCVADNVMDSVRSDGEVDNSRGVGASLLVTPDRATPGPGGSYPYLDGFANIASFGGYSEASGAWRVVAFDADGKDVGERTIYEIAYP